MEKTKIQAIPPASEGRKLRLREMLATIKAHSGAPYELFVARYSYHSGLRSETIRAYLRDMEAAGYIRIAVLNGKLSVKYEGEYTQAYEGGNDDATQNNI